MKYFLIILMLTITISSRGQNMGFRKGLIVTQTDDTIYCLVPVTSSFGSKITYKQNDDAIEEIMPLSKIKYLATETNVYENVTYTDNGNPVQKLMWIEFEGKLNLYKELEITDGRVTRGGEVFGEPFITYVVKKGDSTYLVDKKNFIEVMTPLVSDSDYFLEKITHKGYKYDNLEALIKKYNEISVIR